MPAGSSTFEVGSIRCTVLSDGYCDYPTPWFFPNADPLELSRLLDAHRLPKDYILSPYTCLLIETGRYVVLVDTGAGDSSPSTGAIIARLEVAGIQPENVDTVVLTHAHPDHIGGALDFAGRPAFPNARYILSELEWDFWTGVCCDLRCLRVPEEVKNFMEGHARRRLVPLQHRIETVDGEADIVPGVRAIPAPGHTPGHLALVISSDGERLLHLGDAAVHPLHLEQPAWENGFDLAPDRAIATRRTLLESAAAESMHVMAFHFPFPSFGRVAARAGGGWEWSPGW